MAERHERETSKPELAAHGRTLARWHDGISSAMCHEATHPFERRLDIGPRRLATFERIAISRVVENENFVGRHFA